MKYWLFSIALVCFGVATWGVTQPIGGSNVSTNFGTITSPTVTGPTTFTSSVTVQGASLVTGVLTAATIGGPTTYTSSLTVQGAELVGGNLGVTGSGFTVGTSTFVIAGGSVAVAYRLSTAGQLLGKTLGVQPGGTPYTNRATLDVLGKLGIGNVGAQFNSNTSGGPENIWFTDGATYNYGFGTDTSGNFVWTAGLFDSAAGTVRMTLTQAGGVSIGTVTISATSPPQSQALCLVGGVLGHCNSVVGATGGCTCAAP